MTRELTEWEKLPQPREYSKDPVRQEKRRRQRRANPSKNQIKYRARKLREARQREGIVNQLDEHHVPKASRIKVPVVCHAECRKRRVYHIREDAANKEGNPVNPTRILACGKQHGRDVDVDLLDGMPVGEWCDECKVLAEMYRRRQEWEDSQP